MRFLPVLLTSMTAIGGMIPLVMERSPLYSPLAMVIIGGLITSTLLARIVTPPLYLLLAPGEAKQKKPKRGRRGKGDSDPVVAPAEYRPGRARLASRDWALHKRMRHVLDSLPIYRIACRHGGSRDQAHSRQADARLSGNRRYRSAGHPRTRQSRARR